MTLRYLAEWALSIVVGYVLWFMFILVPAVWMAELVMAQIKARLDREVS